jgi:phage shock protein A
MTETKAEAELLLAQHRRARLAAQSGVTGVAELKQDAAFERLSSKVAESEALAESQLAVGDRNAEQKLAELELEDRVNQLLAELKAKAGPSQG